MSKNSKNKIKKFAKKTLQAPGKLIKKTGKLVKKIVKKLR